MKFLDLIFPKRCIVCDKVLGMAENGICAECRNLVSIIVPPYCMTCGKQIKNDGEVLCPDCRDTYHYYDEGRALYLYDDAMKRSIYRFKYGGRCEYAKYYGEQLSSCFKEYLNHIAPDVLIPIPIHKKRLKKRGYNQAELIAVELSNHLKIPVCNNLLVRTDATLRQKDLNAEERQNNLKKAFKTTQNDVKLSTVVLVDDIYTTGATMDAAAAVLKGIGVGKVYFICLCSGRNT